MSGLSVKNLVIEMTPIRAGFDRCGAPGEFGQERSYVCAGSTPAT
jgi:hypothetical protein